MRHLFKWNALLPRFATNFNAVAADLRQKSSIFAPDLKQMHMFRRNIISKLEAWKQDKKHKPLILRGAYVDQSSVLSDR